MRYCWLVAFALAVAVAPAAAPPAGKGPDPDVAKAATVLATGLLAADPQSADGSVWLRLALALDPESDTLLLTQGLLERGLAVKPVAGDATREQLLGLLLKRAQAWEQQGVTPDNQAGKLALLYYRVAEHFLPNDPKVVIGLMRLRGKGLRATLAEALAAPDPAGRAAKPPGAAPAGATPTPAGAWVCAGTGDAKGGAVRLMFIHAVPAGGAPPPRLSLELGLYWPETPPLLAYSRVGLGEAATDDRRRPLAPFRPPSESPHYYNTATGSPPAAQAQFTLPPDAAKTLRTVSGTVLLLVEDQAEEVVFELAKLDVRVVKTGPVTLQSVDDTVPGRTSFTFEVAADLAFPAGAEGLAQSGLGHTASAFVRTSGGQRLRAAYTASRTVGRTFTGTATAAHAGEQATAVIVRYPSKVRLVRLPFSFRDVPLPKVRDRDVTLTLALGQPAKTLVAAHAGRRLEIFDKNGKRVPELPVGQRGSVSIFTADGTGQDNYTFNDAGVITKHLASFGEDFPRGVWTAVE